MTDVVLVCVRDDIERAEALAETFAAFGFSVSDRADDDGLRDCAAGVVVWSEAALASAVFVEAAQRAMESRKGVVLNLSHAQPPAGARFSFDLTGWNGDPDDESLDRLFFTLDRMVIAARQAKPAGIGTAQKVEPVTAAMLPRAVRAGPAPALRVMATSLVVIGAVLAAGIAIGGGREYRAPAQAVVVRVPAEHGARATLADVVPRGASYDLSAGPVEDVPVGHRGLEPPSAASTR
jgi:hypothetical protein